MREIKFRVWDVRRKVLANVTSIMWLSEDEIEIDHDKNGLREPFQIHGDTAILEQFTGLTDKNGKKIFEGDIYTAFGGQKYEIRFISGSFCGGLLGGDDSIFVPLGWESPEDDEDLYLSNELFKIMEIIGNIHDNPELLT